MGHTQSPDLRTWRPAPGEQITGTLRSIETGTGDYGPYPIAVIEDSHGELYAIKLWHAVLRVEFEALEPQLGQRIGICYEGKHEQKKYHRYQVWRVTDDGRENDEERIFFSSFDGTDLA